MQQLWQFSSFLSIAALALTSGCFTAPLWTVDAMGGDDACFQSKRLRYINPEKSCPFLFECLQIEGEIASFLFLTRSRWSTRDTLPVQLEIEGEKTSESVPVLEGGMRLKLPDATCKKIISALQGGLKVVIVVDGFEQSLHPEQFSTYFEKFTGREFQIGNFYQGILK